MFYKPCKFKSELTRTENSNLYHFILSFPYSFCPRALCVPFQIISFSLCQFFRRDPSSLTFFKRCPDPTLSAFLGPLLFGFLIRTEGKFRWLGFNGIWPVFGRLFMFFVGSPAVFVGTAVTVIAVLGNGISLFRQ